MSRFTTFLESFNADPKRRVSRNPVPVELPALPRSVVELFYWRSVTLHRDHGDGELPVVEVANGDRELTGHANFDEVNIETHECQHEIVYRADSGVVRHQ